MKTTDKLKSLIDSIEQLPPMPQVVVRMLNLIDDPDINFNELIKNIDVPVGVKLLKVANSAYYRTFQSIQSLEHAFSILGLDAIKNLLIGINVANNLTPPSAKDSVFDYREFWRYSVLSAQFSRVLAKLIHYPELGKLYTIGLIHDMGRLLVARYLPKEYDEINALIERDGLDRCYVEGMVLGKPHCQIGAMMAEKWQLSTEMVDVIKFHSNPEKIDEDMEEYKIASIIFSAEKIIDVGGLNLTEDFLQRSQIIDEIISELLAKTAAMLDEQKILAEWSTTIYSNLKQIDDDVSNVVCVLCP